MFKKIKGCFKELKKIKKKLSYEAEKQLALTFYSDIALIFHFDKEIVSLCRKINGLIRDDKNYSNLEACDRYNEKLRQRIDELERTRNRTSRLFMRKKKDIVEKMKKYLK